MLLFKKRNGVSTCQVEPEEEVDLLVDDVLGEDAEPVVPLRAARGAHRRHVAADRLGEGGAERRDAHLLLRPAHHHVHHPLPTVVTEAVLQEPECGVGRDGGPIRSIEAIGAIFLESCPRKASHCWTVLLFHCLRDISPRS